MTQPILQIQSIRIAAQVSCYQDDSPSARTATATIEFVGGLTITLAHNQMVSTRTLVMFCMVDEGECQWDTTHLREGDRYGMPTMVFLRGGLELAISLERGNLDTQYALVLAAVADWCSGDNDCMLTREMIVQDYMSELMVDVKCEIEGYTSDGKIDLPVATSEITVR